MAFGICKLSGRTALAATLLVGLVAARQASASEFTQLARYIPDGANAVALVNSDAIYATPLAQREGWRERYAEAFGAAPMLLPPNAAKGVLAANFNLDAVRPDWQAAALAIPSDPSMEMVAERRGGTVDKVAGLDAVWLPGKICIVKFADAFGVLAPATRQVATRWAEQRKSSERSSLSPYLAEVVGHADDTAPAVTFAVDLSGAVREADVRARLARAKLVDADRLDDAAAVLASIRGVTFVARVQDKISGRLELDFGKSASVIGPFAKDVILSIVHRAGATLEEFETWEPEVGDTSIAISGELSAPSMRRFFSIWALDTGSMMDPETPAAPSPDAKQTQPPAKQQDLVARNSVKYFRGVGMYVEDAQRINRANSIDQALFWLENYARKVESLPTRNVDPELVQYGKYVAATFRSIVQNAAGVSQQVAADSQYAGVTNVRVGLLPTWRTVNYGNYYYEREYAPYGMVDINPQAQAKAQEKSQAEIDKAVAAARKAITDLATDQQTVRTKLSERYGTSF